MSIWFAFLSVAHAETLGTIPLTGLLRDVNGIPASGTRTITVALYDSASGGAWWTDDIVIDADAGLFSALLGDDDVPLDLEAFDAHPELWITVSLDGGTSTRQKVGRVPLAAHALRADRADHIGTIPSAQVATTADISGLDARLTSVNNRLATGMIAFFPGGCPSGWTEYTALRGRVPLAIAPGAAVGTGVGTPLAANGQRTITQVPAHTHGVNPPSTASGNQSADHTHPVDPPNTTSTGQSADHSHSVDPPSTGSSGSGNHQHFVGSSVTDDRNFSHTGGAVQQYGVVADAGGYDVSYNNSRNHTNTNGVYTSLNGDHSHTTDIGAFNSGTTSTNHSHDVNIASFASGTTSAGHTHDVDIAAFTSDSTGAASVDVTMPYLHLVACQLQ